MKFASEAEQLLKSVEDPGQKATVCALLAIAHGVMEAGFDIHDVKNAIEEH
ncbi:hypothetical protein ACF08M_40475 [Streptomyces sp. NPDC015032]|uniref:hypothetical protein n=1 Tax=Streptomyces sp. NPDC015032 TaxID=3364937 RepID=UPI0036F86E7E